MACCVYNFSCLCVSVVLQLYACLSQVAAGADKLAKILHAQDARWFAGFDRCSSVFMCSTAALHVSAFLLHLKLLLLIKFCICAVVGEFVGFVRKRDAACLQAALRAGHILNCILLLH
jgi:hypothetical protein